VLKDEFAQKGFFVDTAENGEEGLKRALADHHDFILLDGIVHTIEKVLGMT